MEQVSQTQTSKEKREGFLAVGTVCMEYGVPA